MRGLHTIRRVVGAVPWWAAAIVVGAELVLIQSGRVEAGPALFSPWVVSRDASVDGPSASVVEDEDSRREVWLTQNQDFWMRRGSRGERESRGLREVGFLHMDDQECDYYGLFMTCVMVQQHGGIKSGSYVADDWVRTEFARSIDAAIENGSVAASWRQYADELRRGDRRELKVVWGALANDVVMGLLLAVLGVKAWGAWVWLVRWMGDWVRGGMEFE